MKEYELINPFDPYTFEAEDYETAALVVLSLSTAYGARPKDGGDEVPILIFFGGDAATDWYKETFGTSFEQAIRTPEKTVRLARALGSMMYGHFEDRARYNAALETIDDPEKKTGFIAKWQDGRSSLNNIGKQAHQLARLLADAYGIKEDAK